jgi:hypothetical protein
LTLDRIFNVASDRLFVDSPISVNQVFDFTASEAREILVAGRVMRQLPMVYFTKGEETRDAYNWFLPNKRALMPFVESSGFKLYTREDDGGNRASVSATKGEHAFTPGLEEWNDAASISPR